jgi:predicted metal-binding membrane protein
MVQQFNPHRALLKALILAFALSVMIWALGLWLAHDMREATKSAQERQNPSEIKALDNPNPN